MGWIRLDSGVSHHPKILELADALNVSRREARGIVLALWDFCMLSAQDGHLGAMHPRRLARVCDWDGDPEQLADALVESELLDRVGESLEVHGWSERTGSWQEAQKKAQSRKRVRDNPGQSETVLDSPGLSRTPPSDPSVVSLGSDLNSSLQGESEGEPRQNTPPVLPEPTPLTEALALVRCALAAWEAEGLPVVTDYVDADRAGRFAQAVEYVARRHGRTPEDIVLSAVAAAGASPWCRGLTAANPDPVDSGWLVAPMKATDRGTRPLKPGEHIERIERLIAGYYDRDHAAERVASKPRTQAQQAVAEYYRLKAEEDAADLAAGRVPPPTLGMFEEPEPTGPPRGMLRLASGETERRARWVRGGDA